MFPGSNQAAQMQGYSQLSAMQGDDLTDNYLMSLIHQNQNAGMGGQMQGRHELNSLLQQQQQTLGGNSLMGALAGGSGNAGMGNNALLQQQRLQQILGGAGAGLYGDNSHSNPSLGSLTANNLNAQLNTFAPAGPSSLANLGMFQQPITGLGQFGSTDLFGLLSGSTSLDKRGKKGRSSGVGSKQGRGAKDEFDSDDDEDDLSADEGEEDDLGDNRSKKKHAGGIDDAEKRHLALQEKNRRAQRRFRERQKSKLADLHRQIDDLTSKVSSLQSENQALHSRTNILEKVLDMRNEQIQVMQETKETSATLAGQDDELSALQDMGGKLITLTPEIIKDLSSDQIYKIYQMYVRELSSLVNLEKSNESHLTPEQVTQLESLVKDLSMMIMRLGVVKPLETRKFIVISRQYLGSTESEVIELWKNVVAFINLSEQQKREVVELKRMFILKIDPIMEERKQLNIQIQSNLPQDTFATKNALTYIKAHDAVIKLRDNLRTEQHVVLEFAIAVFRGVFTPWQMASLLVKVYPAVPDALGIASALTFELGEPEPQSRQLTMQLGGYLEGHGMQGHALMGGQMGFQAAASLENHPANSSI